MHRDNITPISNDGIGIVRLGPMVRSQIRVPAGADLRRTDRKTTKVVKLQ